MKNGDFVISAESGREFGVFWNALKALSKRREHLKYFSKIEINEELRFSNLFTQQKSVGVLLLEREKESIEELKMLKKETKTIKYCTLLFFVQYLKYINNIIVEFEIKELKEILNFCRTGLLHILRKYICTTIYENINLNVISTKSSVKCISISQ